MVHFVKLAEKAPALDITKTPSRNPYFLLNKNRFSFKELDVPTVAVDAMGSPAILLSPFTFPYPLLNVGFLLLFCLTL